MKRIILFISITILAFVSSGNVAFAQWRIEDFPADELLDVKANSVCTYIKDGTQRVSLLRVMSQDVIGLEVAKDSFYSENEYVSVIIGFYEDDKLVDKNTLKFKVVEYNLASSPFYKSENIATKVMQFLKERGNVRIVAKLNSGDRFDVMLPKEPKLRLIPE